METEPYGMEYAETTEKCGVSNAPEESTKAFRDYLWNDVQKASITDDTVPNNSQASNPAREELGRATWRLIHTMATKFPLKATEEDSLLFETFILLLGRIYPCSECSGHFRQLLSKKEPKIQSRKDAVLWACEAHNIVNKRLGKKLFNCEMADEAWKCGCADSEEYKIK
ncbi:hypothetical protein MP638_002649 [Amoeboaphelidium occidentale]|nr:hypothetical protein MP638_002649 [Amoeboaphelidium occidentale]